MSRTQRRIQQAANRGVYVFRWPWETCYDVYADAEWMPRVRMKKRDAVALAYRIAVSKRHKLTVEVS